MSEHDVAIVGAGPAGLLLACLLAQAGTDVVVLEKREGRDDRTRAMGVHPPGLAALAAAGVAEPFRAEALALTGGTVLSRGRTLANVDFPSGREVLTIPQPDIERLLRDRLIDLAPGSVRGGIVVQEAHRDGNDRARLQARDRDGREREFSASVVVVADGVHSSLRERLGVPWRTIPGAGDYSMLDVAGAPPDLRARLYLEPSGVVESFPMPGAGRRWVLRESDGTRRSPESFVAEIRRRTGVEIDAQDAMPQRFRAGQHRAARLVDGSVILLGDAAHEISPIGGQGMNLAWIAACRLAVALTERADRRTALRAYEGVSLRAAAAAQRRARFNMAMGARLPVLPRAGRDAAISALARGAIGRRLLDAMTMRGL